MGLFRYLKNIGSNPSSTGHNPWGWASVLIVSLIGLQATSVCSLVTTYFMPAHITAR